MKNLSGKVALVTASSRGIGRAIAKRLAKDGALVVINYAGNAEAANSLVTEIATIGGEAIAIQAKLGSASETDTLYARLASELQNRAKPMRLDVLVNDAGVGHFGRLLDATEQNFDDVFAANAKAPFLVTRSALPHLTPGGRIINVSSGASRRPGT